MAGTVVTTEETFSNVKKITFAWTCSAGGAADATTTKFYTGDILRAVAIPGTGGDAPTALYDGVINDDDSVDVMDGAFANLSATLTTQIGPLGAATIANTQLTLGITNAGDANKGTVILYIR